MKADAPCPPRSSIRNPQSCKGFTLIELIVVITIVVILASVLLKRIWLYQEQAEKAAMEQTVGALKTALVMQYGHLLTRGQEAEIKNLVAENPMRWLMQKPVNYAGEYFGMQPATIAAGNWAFDMKSRELVYVPYRTDYFDPGKDGLKWVRYRARLEYEPLRGSKGKGEQELTGVLFEPVERYQWLEQGTK